MELNYVAMGKRIADKRNQLGMMQLKLSEATNISETYISHIERAKTKASLKVICKISVALNTSLDYLVFGIPDHEKRLEMDNLYQELLELFPEQQEYLKIFLSTMKQKNTEDKK